MSSVHLNINYVAYIWFTVTWLNLQPIHNTLTVFPVLCTCSGCMLPCRYTFNSVAGETSPSSFVTDLRCVCVFSGVEWEGNVSPMASCLPLSHTHWKPAWWVRFSTSVCVCVSVNMWPDRWYVTVHVLCCVGVCCFIAAVLVWPQRAAAVRCLAPCVFVCHSGFFSQSFGFSFS